jgi:CheY-like chemotaxis protein
MDVQMPEMDGFAATAAIRAGEKETGVHLPIVAMTAHAMKGDKERCLAAGMDAYISKPIQAKALLELIEKVAGVRSGIPEPAVSSASVPEGVPDMNSVLELLDGDHELLQEVVDLFLRDCPEQLAAIREGIARNQATGLERASHALKGSVSNFAVPAIFHAAQRLENIGREGDLTRAPEALADLEEKLVLLNEALANFRKEHVS